MFDFLLTNVLHASSKAFIRALPMNKANILSYVALLTFLSFYKLLDIIRTSPNIMIMIKVPSLAFQYQSAPITDQGIVV